MNPLTGPCLGGRLVWRLHPGFTQQHRGQIWQIWQDNSQDLSSGLSFACSQIEISIFRVKYLLCPASPVWSVRAGMWPGDIKLLIGTAGIESSLGNTSHQIITIFMREQQNGWNIKNHLKAKPLKTVQEGVVDLPTHLSTIFNLKTVIWRKGKWYIWSSECSVYCTAPPVSSKWC